MKAIILKNFSTNNNNNKILSIFSFRKAAERALARIGRSAIAYDQMLQILSLHPIQNK